MDTNNQGQSGGPTTNEGKQVSRLNALKHGLTANLLSKYDDFDYSAFFNLLIEEIKPTSLLEEIITERIAVSYLRITRANKLEKNLIESIVNPKTKLDYGIIEVYSKTVINEDGEDLKLNKDNFEYISSILNRYYISSENRLYRAFRELREMRK